MNQALIKHFKLSEADLAQMQAALQPHQTLLDVLFEKNLIDPVAYLAWAKEYYALPVLKIEFLNKTNNVEALLDRYKNVFPKNVVPFHELDGTLYVMCLEPTPFEAPQAVQYVLAPYDVLQKYVTKNETSIVNQEAVQMPEEKENTNPLFKDLEASKGNSPLDSFSFENISLGDAKPNDEPPAGAEDKIEISLEEKADIPAGLNFPPSPTNLDERFVTDKPIASVDLQSFKFEGIMPVLEGQKAPGEAAATPPKITIMTADSLVAKHPPKNKTASTITPPPPPSQVVPIHSPMPAASPASNGPQFDGILHAMKKYFDQTMVLLFTNGNLEPKAWDATWTKISHAHSTIDVSTPSIFRIVNETQNPYHGHVVTNPVNEAFFNSWNKGQLPEHITICPIMHEKKIFGMVLGTTTKDGSKKYQLHHIQEIANDAFAMLSAAKVA
ncbi:MAG: hypothetical protein V4596_00590 [Bdellovibrionota bacterium]